MNLEGQREESLKCMLDLGASRRVASFFLRHSVGNPDRQRILELYIEDLLAWLRNILSDLEIPKPGLSRIVEFYGFTEYPWLDDSFSEDPHELDDYGEVD